MYLCIQNAGVAPVEAFTLLGMSEARTCGVAGIIGKFGSGTKHAINLLLRKGIEFHIYCGKTRLEFFYEIERINTANGVTETAKVKCKLSGDKNRSIDCGWVLDFGAMDWTDTHMALREFVSNAIDCTKINGVRDGLEVKPEANRRAKADHTRIFIDLYGEGVQDFYNKLGFYFLHFSGKPEQPGQRFLEKNPTHAGPVIYREGVFVRTLSANKPAAFDYNFKDSEINIDECRNSSEYTLRASIAMAINQAPSDVLAAFFAKMENTDLYEAGLDDYYLGYRNDETVKANWKTAWESFAGDAVVSHSVNAVSDYAEKKGHKVKHIKSDVFVKVAEKLGVPSVVTILGEHAGSGKVPTPVTIEAQQAVDTVWAWCEAVEMTNGKSKPTVECFKQLMDAGGECFGYYSGRGDVVHLREDVGGKLALKVVLEEVAHYITGATDNSRDFQNFAFDMVVELAL